MQESRNLKKSSQKFQYLIIQLLQYLILDHFWKFKYSNILKISCTHLYISFFNLNTQTRIFKHTHNIFQLTIIKLPLFSSPHFNIRKKNQDGRSHRTISSNSKNYYFASRENFDSTRNTWPATTFAIISTSFPISPWSRSEIKAGEGEGPATKVVVAEQKNDWHECGWREERKQILSMHLAARRNRKARLGETEREKSCLEIAKPGGVSERIELRDPGHKINRRIFIPFCHSLSSPLFPFHSFRFVLLLYFHPLSPVSC